MSNNYIVCKASTEQLEANSRELVAIISTPATDRYNEIVSPKGANLEAFKKNPVVLWGHNMDIPPIGKALWVKSTKEDVRAKVKFADTPLGNEVFQLYQDGFLQAFSIGFRGNGHAPTEKEIKKNPELQNVRYIWDEWELMEFSAVTVPANPEALALAVSKGYYPLASKAFELPEVQDNQEKQIEVEAGTTPPVVEKKKSKPVVLVKPVNRKTVSYYQPQTQVDIKTLVVDEINRIKGRM